MRALFLTITLSIGCSWVSASPYEYAAYRKTRVGATFEERIAAADEYLKRYPNGAYAEDVRRWYKRAEPVFFETRQRRLGGLEAYLKALPEGPHAVEARSRLRIAEEERNRPDSLSLAARATEDRLAAAQLGRERAKGEIAFWIDALSDPAAYRSPFSQGPVDLVVNFTLSLPAPQCRTEEDVRTCEKTLVVPYVVPGREGLTDRELAFTVTIRQDAEGRPRSARIEGEALFSRMEEINLVRVLSKEDRKVAVDAAVTTVLGAFESHVSAEPDCKKVVGEGEVLRRECKGLRAVVTASKDPEGFDGIRFDALD